MYDLGQQAVLVTAPVNADRQAYVPVGLALSIRQPDGTTISPAITPVAEGFSASVIPTQVGRHAARWLSTDGWADTSTFDVWPADPRFLFNLAEARAALGGSTRSNASVRDDQLELYIAATTPVIEDIVGPVVPETRTYTFDGDVGAVLLPAAVVPGSVTVSVDGSSTDVTVNAAAGIVYAGGGYGWFSPGRQNVVVTAKVGMAAVPPNVKLAALEEFRFLWQVGQQAAHPGLGSDDTEVEYTQAGFAVPRRVIELCAGYRRLGAIG